MDERKTRHSVMICRIDKTDPEYAQGVRAIIEQVDKDRFHFSSITAALQFMAPHGLAAVSNKDMETLRAAEVL